MPSTSATGAALVLSTGSPKVRICSAMPARLPTACRTTSTSRRRPARPRPRSHVELPDTSFTLRTDRGVFSHGRLDAGHRAAAARRSRAAADGRRRSTSAAAPGRSPWPSPGRAPGADGVGGRRQRAGAGAVRGERRRQRPRQRRRRRARRRARRRPLRRHLVEPADPHRQGRRCTSCWPTWLDRLTPAGRAVLVVQKHLGADSLQRWLIEQGWPTDAPGVGQGLPPPRRPPPTRHARSRELFRVCAAARSRGSHSISRETRRVRRGAGRRRRGRGRPSGGGRRSRARPSSSQRGGADRVAALARRRRRCPGTARRASATSSLPGPDTAARAANGGSPSSRRRARSGSTSRPGSASSAAWTTSWRGRNVCTSSRPPPARGPTSRAAAHEQRHRLLGGPVARRQQLDVDVEEGHDVGARHPVQHGLGADVDPGRRPAAPSSPPVTATTGRPAAASSSSRSRVTPGLRLANADAPQTQAHGRARRARSAGRRACRRRPGRRRPRSARSGPAPGSSGRRGSGPGPAMLCTHTTVRSAARRWAISGDVTSDVFHGSSRLRSTTSTSGQLGPLVVDRRPRQPLADRRQPDHGRARRHQQHRRAGPRGPARRRRRGRATSGCAPPAAPRRARRRRRRRRGPGTAPTPRPARR